MPTTILPVTYLVVHHFNKFRTGTVVDDRCCFVSLLFFLPLSDNGGGRFDSLLESVRRAIHAMVPRPTVPRNMTSSGPSRARYLLVQRIELLWSSSKMGVVETKEKGVMMG